VRHLGFTGVDQIVSVIGGRKVPALPRHGREDRDSQHQEQCDDAG
jgi:hypothetical protein